MWVLTSELYVQPTSGFVLAVWGLFSCPLGRKLLHFTASLGETFRMSPFECTSKPNKQLTLLHRVLQSRHFTTTLPYSMRVSDSIDVSVQNAAQWGNRSSPTNPSSFCTNSNSTSSSHNMQQPWRDIEDRGLKERENVDKREEWISKQPRAHIFIPSANGTLDGSGNPFGFFIPSSSNWAIHHTPFCVNRIPMPY